MSITTIGPHRVQHGNIMDGIDALMQGEKADLVYSDPPWGQGNLSYWQTMNTKMTGVPKLALSLTDFLDAVLTAIATYAQGYVLLEYGCQWRSKFIEAVETYDLQHYDTVTPSYRSGDGLRPYDLHLFGVLGTLPIKLDPAIASNHGIAVVRAAVPPLAVEGGILRDPCCGLGLMAQVAMENGMRFRGNEINGKRLQETIVKLEKGTK